MKMKYLIFFTSLLFVTLATFGNAFYRHKQYYPTMIHLSKSKVSLALSYFYVANLLWAVIYSTTLIFFGELRSNEREELRNRSIQITSETLLTFALFKDLSPQFAFSFVILIYMKTVHWLAEKRIGYLERSPVQSKLFHARALSHIILLGLMDFIFMASAFSSIDRSLHLAFGFEYAILIPSVCSFLLKYILHIIEIYRETPLQDKTIILLIGQVILDVIRIVLIFPYLAVMFRHQMLPAFAFRQIFDTVRSFWSKANNVISFRKAVLYMNKCCPSATNDDLRRSDTICIVCREEMTSEAKKLPCGHIFHGYCLRAWFIRQQTCPTCRLKILNNTGKVEPVDHHCRQTFNLPPPAKTTHLTSHSHTSVNHNHETNPEIQSLLSFDIHQQPYKSSDKLKNHSDQELFTVDQNTFEKLENKSKCLRSVAEKLDSTAVLMQAYCQTNGSSMEKEQVVNTNEMPAESCNSI